MRGRYGWVQIDWWRASKGRAKRFYSLQLATAAGESSWFHNLGERRRVSMSDPFVHLDDAPHSETNTTPSNSNQPTRFHRNNQPQQDRHGRNRSTSDAAGIAPAAAGGGQAGGAGSAASARPVVDDARPAAQHRHGLWEQRGGRVLPTPTLPQGEILDWAPRSIGPAD